MMGKMPASLQESYLHTALTHLGNSYVNCSHPTPPTLKGCPTEGDVTAKPTTAGPNPAFFVWKVKMMVIVD